MDAKVEIKWNEKTKMGLKKFPNSMLYSMAKQTLDLSAPMIPMSDLKNHSGTMRRTSFSRGVRGGNEDYYIGSYTYYAKYVWNMEGVNWTTPGTNNKWFARTLKKYKSTIMDNAFNQTFKRELK